MTDKIVVLCACGSPEEAERLARLVVELHLAACVNITAPMRSIYRWKGKIEDADECLLLIKSTRARFEELSDALRAAHSYDVPEILALPAVAGSPSYLNWIDTETHE